MKRRNFNKSILQQGGLMIEALAMLGLIAVVTPTMYKKSAERTMEVEDINTAATIRTINAAANDYVSANYATILGDMVKNNETNRKLNPEDLKTYLPYGFDIEKALYNYDGNDIKISVARPAGSNNLTTLMLFPAKMDADSGIGQERTARIAALIGSSGGYVTDSHKARGIGGIWKLEGDDFTNNFGNADANTYSIVTASADTISASAGNEMDYTKYLQRGKDAGDDNDSQWKNTMRTDLYMGGPEGSTEDVYREATGPWSIRNIKSLIVGANTSGGVDGEGNDLADVAGYGLYISGKDSNPNKNAYIHGSVEAGNGQLNADENNLKYGKDAGTDDDGNSLFGFNVDKEGTISNLKNLYLAQKFHNGWNRILIGALDDYDDDDTNYIIDAYHDDNNGTGHVSLLGDDIAQFHSYGSNVYDDNDRDLVASSNDRIVFLRNGWRRLGTTDRDELVEKPKYSYNEPYFPMRIGSNVKAEGLLAAGQLDTQKIRAASLSVGSYNIDDNDKWLNVDTYGITIKDVSRHYDDEDYYSTGTYGSFNNNGILLRVSDDKDDTNGVTDEDRGALGTDGGRDTSEHDIQFNLRNSKTFANGTSLPNVAELFAEHTDIRGKKMARVSGQGTIIQAKEDIPEWKYDYDRNYRDKTKDFRDTVDPNTLVLRNDDMQIRIHTVGHDGPSGDYHAYAETVFEPRGISPDYNWTHSRTVFKDQSVNVSNGNFRIAKTYGGNNFDSVFSVRGNDDDDIEDLFDQKFNDCFVRHDSYSGGTDTEKKYWETGGYDVAMHGNVVIAPQGSKAPTANVSIGKFNKMAGINILTRKYMNQETISSANNKWYDRTRDNYGNIIMIDQGATDTDNNNRDHGSAASNTDYRVDPGTVYIRKGYVEVHGEKDIPSATNPSTKNAYEGNGVIVASRLVANNPTSGAHGATVPQLVTTTELQDYENKGSAVNRYDTYMVNPAYTSVMHDIKLTTRGGARLSDILPDFINKGIYVVNNTFLEVENDNLDYKKWPTTYNKDKIEIDNKTYTALGKSIDFGKTWASPFMGVVPAPQCPPGYGRVITLTPASFETGISGSLQTDDKGQYYVLPERVQDEQYALTVRGQRPQYEPVAIESTSGSMNISINNSALNLSNAQANVSELSGISTAKYVLATNELKKSDGKTLVDPITPLTVQQSTWLKSGVQKLTSDGSDTGYVQGWATTMGFLYKNALYMPLLDSGADSKKFSWNIFPVMPYTLEGYATVYCYFDRTNLYGGRGSTKYNAGGGNVDSNYESYIDKLNYMSNPSGSTMPNSANKAADEKYRNRLNDPNLKYDEVW